VRQRKSVREKEEKIEARRRRWRDFLFQFRRPGVLEKCLFRSEETTYFSFSASHPGAAARPLKCREVKENDGKQHEHCAFETDVSKKKKKKRRHAPHPASCFFPPFFQGGGAFRRRNCVHLTLVGESLTSCSPCGKTR
jgi:hypothetical protein